MMMPGPQLNWNGGSPIDRSCRIIKRNLTNIQDFVLLILLFQIVIVTFVLRNFNTNKKSLKGRSKWVQEVQKKRAPMKFMKDIQIWRLWPEQNPIYVSWPSKKDHFFSIFGQFQSKIPLNLFCQSCRFRSKTSLNRHIMIYQNYEISKLVKNHDNSRLIKIDFAKWFQIFPLDHSIR